MKSKSLFIVLCLELIFSIANSAPETSPPLNERVIELYFNNNGGVHRHYFSVDVDMDGEDDVLFYADDDGAGPFQDPGFRSRLRLITASDVYVSCVNIPLDSSKVAAFTTFTKDSILDSALFYPPGSTYDPWWTWETGDFPFHGFEIAGGIPSMDGYLGVKMIKGPEEYYGWIRLIFPVSYDYLNETGYVKIKESSYESTPSSSIVAGEGITEDIMSYSDLLALKDKNDIDLKVNGVSHRLCLLQESTDLSTWNTIFVKYSTETDLIKTVPKEDSDKFYRWQITENLEEMY